MNVSNNSSLSVSAGQLFSGAEMMTDCFNSSNGIEIFLAFAVTNALTVLPITGCVLNIGFQRRRRQLFTSTASSYTDLMTYHMLTMEIISLTGSACYCFGMYMKNMKMLLPGFYFFSLVLPGQSLFHCLTCVERYLAVVRPVTYQKLRKTSGLRIRNISIGCVWFLCIGWMGLSYLYLPSFPDVPFFCVFGFSLSISLFCSITVLHALTRPGPGERGGNRVVQSKRRAFYTIMGIMAVLLLRFVGVTVCVVLLRIVSQIGGNPCVLAKCLFWFCLPSSLVLPLLFLHRAGKLSCCKNNTEFK